MIQEGQTVGDYIYIEGIVVLKDGNTRKFRPSDWVERIAGWLGHFDGQHHWHNDERLEPVYRDGMRCVRVHMSLLRDKEQTFRQVICFAKQNSLHIIGCEKFDAWLKRDECSEEPEGKEVDKLPQAELLVSTS